jgi:hypothetical protein
VSKRDEAKIGNTFDEQKTFFQIFSERNHFENKQIEPTAFLAWLRKGCLIDTVILWLQARLKQRKPFNYLSIKVNKILF